MWDALTQRFETITLVRDPACPLCGAAPRIRDLSHHSDSGSSLACAPA
jgi:adenylyltransferase/sulfurtransferase